MAVTTAQQLSGVGRVGLLLRWIDMRDLGQVLEHAGPLPHPAQDQTN